MAGVLSSSHSLLNAALDIAEAEAQESTKVVLSRVEALRVLGRCAAARREPMGEVRSLLEEAAALARKNHFHLLVLQSLGDLQRLVNVPQGREGEGQARLEEAALAMGNRPLSAFESVKNW